MRTALRTEIEDMIESSLDLHMRGHGHGYSVFCTSVAELSRRLARLEQHPAILTGQDLCVGDVVRLKSGGPEMTVVHVSSQADCVDCEWFDGATAKHRRVNPAVLERVDAGSVAAT